MLQSESFAFTIVSLLWNSLIFPLFKSLYTFFLITISTTVLEELGEEKSRLLIQELAEQELALSSLVEEGVEWSVSEEEEEEEEYAEGWSPSEEEDKEEEYEEESVDEEQGEFEPELELEPGGTT